LLAWQHAEWELLRIGCEDWLARDSIGFSLYAAAFVLFKIF
jgi:hypothetical protein